MSTHVLALSRMTPAYRKQVMREDRERTERALNAERRAAELRPCHYCGLSLRRALWTWDHIVPKSLGGPDRRANLVVSCARCNNLKDAKRSGCTCLQCLSAWRQFGPSGWAFIAVADVATVSCAWPWGSLVLPVAAA